MQYTLSVKSRLMLLGILPAEGNLTTIRIVRELREGLSFSETEHKQLKFRVDGGMMSWDEKAKVPDKVLDIGPKAAEVIREALGKLDKDQKLTADHLELVDLFEYKS
ncbi:MAG: hypothetical protein ABIH03_14150 [Pseudomonadota bacterium]